MNAKIRHARLTEKFFVPGTSALTRENRFLHLWNYVFLVGTGWYALSIPVYIALDLEFSRWIIGLDVALTLFFSIDIFLNFHTAYREDGTLITDKETIRRRYLKSWFILDLLATIPFDLFFLALPGEPHWVVDFVRLLRVLRIFRLAKVVSHISSYGKTALVAEVVLDAKSYIKVALMLFWVVAVLNVIACGWVMINPSKWVGDPFTDYIFGLYWTVTTLTTVGYGDITPDSNLGRIYTMFIMLVGVGMYGFVIGNISSVMSRAKAAQISQREKVVNLAHFLQQYQIPKDLQSDIFSFYQHYLFEREVQLSGVIAELPIELQQNANIYVSVYMLKTVPIFAHVNQAHLVEIGQHLSTRILSPGEVIIHAGEIGNEMYFLSHGIVEVLSPEGKPIAKLRTGSFFGEVALLQEIKRTATVRANTYCDLYVLNKSDFKKVIANNPDLKKQLDETAQMRDAALKAAIPGAFFLKKNKKDSEKLTEGDDSPAHS